MPEQIDGIDAKILHLIQSNAAHRGGRASQRGRTQDMYSI